LTEYVVSSTWRRTNWPTGTMTFMRWATPDQAGGTPAKLRAVGEKYAFVDSGNLNRLGKCAISTEVSVEYKRGSTRKTGKLLNWQGTNGIPDKLSIKLDKPEDAPCIIDYFNCKHATNGAGQNDYRCTMAGYRGAFDDCSRHGFANTFNAGLVDGWNSLSGQDALNPPNNVNHVKIYNFVAGSGPFASLPTCSGASANTQSDLDSEVQVSQSFNEPEGSRTDAQSDLDGEAKVSSNEPVSEGVFPENKRSILLLSIAVTVFCISLRHYRNKANKAAGPKEALTMLLEDEI